jgi:hypothetical protein
VLAFLEALKLTAQDRHRLEALARLGAESPRALLELRKASPAAFDQAIGADRIGAIVQVLRGELSEAELRVIDSESDWAPSFGARLGGTPAA